MSKFTNCSKAHSKSAAVPSVPAVPSVMGGLFLAVLLLSSCSGEKEQALIPEDYSSWEHTTTRELDYPIPGHESNYRRIYINSTGLNYTVEETEGEIRHAYPPGTILVKEVYSSLEPAEGEEPMRLTVMVKRPDDERSRGGWLWVLKPLDAGEEKVITSEFCVTCHSNANEQHPYGDGNPQGAFRDFVYFPPQRSEEGSAEDNSEE